MTKFNWTAKVWILEAHGVTNYNCYKYTLVLLPLHSTLVQYVNSVALTENWFCNDVLYNYFLATC